MKQSRAGTKFVTSKGDVIEMDRCPRQIFPSPFTSITSHVIIHCSYHEREHRYPPVSAYPRVTWLFMIFHPTLPYFLKPFIDKARKNSEADRRHDGKHRHWPRLCSRDQRGRKWMNLLRQGLQAPWVTVTAPHVRCHKGDRIILSQKQGE